MRTAGIDAASSPGKTATCWVSWDGGTGFVEVNDLPEVSDEEVARCVAEADWIGIDIPLGWPSAFVAAVAAHQARKPWGGASMETLRLRETDRWVTTHARCPGNDVARCHPMSASTDRIGVPALRFARILGPIDRSGEAPTTADGSARVVETYPAASLFVWGLPHRGYKGSTAAQSEARRQLVARIREEVSLEADDATWERCTNSDHALDALIASLTVRAKALGLCHPVPREHLAVARVEGWIALPLPGSLGRLRRDARRGTED